MAETDIKLTITPVLGLLPGVSDFAEQLRRTAAALTGLADSLTRLSDGSPGAARTVPVTDNEAQDIIEGVRDTLPPLCPYVIGQKHHDAHRFQVDMDVSEVGADVLSFDCPGHPVRPWHAGG